MAFSARRASEVPQHDQAGHGERAVVAAVNPSQGHAALGLSEGTASLRHVRLLLALPTVRGAADKEDCAAPAAQVGGSS